MTSVAFSENGYYMASAADNGLINVRAVSALAVASLWNRCCGLPVSPTRACFPELSVSLLVLDVCCCQLWDLRKLKKVNDVTLSSKGVFSLAFDYSGSYLAAGGDSVVGYACKRAGCPVPLLAVSCGALALVSRCVLVYTTRSVYNVSDWSSITTFADHGAAVTGVRFGANANKLVSVSLDKNIHVYGN